MTSAAHAGEGAHAPGLASSGLRALFLPLTALILLLSAAAPPDSLWCSLSLCMAGLAIYGMRRERRSVLSLLFLSLFATLRYLWWRGFIVGETLRAHGTHGHWLERLTVLLLLGAELHAALSRGCDLFPMCWPLQRKPLPLPGETEHWPHVDVLIPTLNEPLEVVRFTTLAAAAMDWPPERLHVWVLDDGNRETIAEFCREADIGYLARVSQAGAKAGNLNAALQQTSSTLVLVLDADHVPVRSFLQLTAGLFHADERLAVVQTPQHLFTPGPYRHNLGEPGWLREEDELFHRVVQDGNDLWNAARFSGSGAVLRRAALEDVGGFAEKTPGQDVYTSVRLHRKGWRTAFLNLPQAAGRAPSQFRDYVQQRERCAVGALQVLRAEGSVLGRALTVAQRICYLQALLHGTSALARAAFLLLPMLALFTGWTILPGRTVDLLAVALPHLLLLGLASARAQGRWRIPLWGEVYQTALAPFLLLPVLRTVLTGEAGERTRSTQESSALAQGALDLSVAWPFLVLLALQLAALGTAARRYLLMHLHGHSGSSAIRYLPDASIALPVLWVLCNLALVAVVLGTTLEKRQRRAAPRIRLRWPVRVSLNDQKEQDAVVMDLSTTGVHLLCASAYGTPAHQRMMLKWRLGEDDVTLPGRVVSANGPELRVCFDDLTTQQAVALAHLLYARADRWAGEELRRTEDRPMSVTESAFRLLQLAGRSLASVSGHLLRIRKGSHGLRWAAGLLFLAVALCFGARRSASERLVQAQTGTVRASRFFRTLDLKAPSQTPAGADASGQPSPSLAFDLAPDEVISEATLRVRLLPFRNQSGRTGSLTVLLNGAPAAVLSAEELEAGPSALHLLPLAPELLVQHNSLAFALSGVDPRTCPKYGCMEPPSPLLKEASIELHGVLLPLRDAQVPAAWRDVVPPTPQQGRRWLPALGTVPRGVVDALIAPRAQTPSPQGITASLYGKRSRLFAAVQVLWPAYVVLLCWISSVLAERSLRRRAAHRTSMHSSPA